METRVEGQFTTLIANGVRHVLLSAFGCGAFNNDPSDTAWMYKQAVERHRASLAVIAFAIFYAGHGQDNYKIIIPSPRRLMRELHAMLVAAVVAASCDGCGRVSVCII